MKKFKGFTLIELIVVIAIIGVLCAILVPTMMGWVTRSRIKTNNANAKSIFTSAQEATTNLDNQGKTWSAGVIKKGDGSDLGKEIASLNTESNATLAKWSVKLSNDGAEKAVFASNGVSYMGQFPDEIDETSKTDYADLT